MKRLSFLVALVAVLALASAASAAPTFSGSASLSLTGKFDNDPTTSPYPSVGSPVLTLYIGAQDGSNWSLNGTLASVDDYNCTLEDWKLSVNAGSVKFNVSNDLSVGADKQDLLGLLPAAYGDPGSVNHLRVETTVAPFSVMYDKVQGGADRLFVDAAAGTVIPASLGVTAKVNVPNPTVVGYTSYTLKNGIYMEAAAGFTSGKTDAAAYGAELTLPVSSALSVYLVGKRFGSNYSDGNPGMTPTLAQVTYTQPQYRLLGYAWRRTLNADGSLNAVRTYGQVSAVQVPGDSVTWFDHTYTDANGYSWDPINSPGGSGYRSLKGLAVSATYGQDAYAAPSSNYNNLNVAVGSPLIPGKAYGDLYIQVPGTSLGLDTKQATTWAHLYVTLTSKLNSQTRVKLTKAETKYQADVWEYLGYTVSGSSSIGLTLTKAADSSAVGYTTSFSVSF